MVALAANCLQFHIQIIKTYIDRAKTATNDRRPEFQEMIRDSKLGTFKLVLVHKP
jgi:site-specific DNA recombinase